LRKQRCSLILRHGNIAFKKQLKLVNGFKRLYLKIHALKNKKTMWRVCSQALQLSLYR
jgi:hypothetical protein